MDWRGKTVFVIDDEQHMRWLLAALLRHHGAMVHVASEGKTGLKEILEVKPDLVILDILLPGMSGREVLRILRRESLVPIVMLSSIHRSEEMARCFEAGADDYVTKPFDSDKLLERCWTAMQQRAHPVQKSPSVPDHTVHAL